MQKQNKGDALKRRLQLVRNTIRPLSPPELEQVTGASSKGVAATCSITRLE